MAALTSSTLRQPADVTLSSASSVLAHHAYINIHATPNTTAMWGEVHLNALGVTEEIANASQYTSPERVKDVNVECSCAFQVKELEIGIEREKECESVCQPACPGKNSVACQLSLHGSSRSCLFLQRLAITTACSRRVSLFLGYSMDAYQPRSWNSPALLSLWERRGQETGSSSCSFLNGAHGPAMRSMDNSAHMRSFVLMLHAAVEEVRSPGPHHFMPMAVGFVIKWNVGFVKCNIVHCKVCMDVLQRGYLEKEEPQRGFESCSTNNTFPCPLKWGETSSN